MSKGAEILGKSAAGRENRVPDFARGTKAASAGSVKSPAVKTSEPAKKTSEFKAKSVRPNWAQKAPPKAKKPQNLAALILAHAAVVLSLMYLVFFVIDRINTAMEFINHDMTKALIAVLAVVSIVNAEMLLCTRFRRGKKNKRR